MSYILDALRRADAERERGAVPGLHTQQFGAMPGDEERPARPRLLIGVIAVLVVALVAVLGWSWFGRPETAAGLAQAPVVAPRPVTSAPLPAAAPTPLPAPAPAASAPAASALPASPSAAAASAPAPRRTAARPAPRREPTPAAEGSASTVAAAAGGERIWTQAELPEAIRRELPRLAFGGASYSSDKASRLVFLNGQVFREGDTVAPGVVVRQIRQKGAVLAFKGYRYEVGF